MSVLVSLSLAHLLSALLAPVYLVISAVLVGWYDLFTHGLGLSATGGLAWVLSIVGLTAVVRTALIPLVLRQLRSGRDLQRIQPQVRELQARHGHDRERLAQETMRLYQESGTNPFASCLPLLVQLPIFVALFRLLDQAARGHGGHGLLTDALARRLGGASLWGQLPLSASFLHPGGRVAVQVVAVLLVVVMTATTYLTQRRLTGQDAPQRRLMLALPVVLAVSGLAFPLGVLVYWVTSNFWTMGQQLLVMRDTP